MNPTQPMRHPRAHWHRELNIYVNNCSRLQGPRCIIIFIIAVHQSDSTGLHHCCTYSSPGIKLGYI